MKNRPHLNKDTILVDELINQTPLYPILLDIFIEVRKARRKTDVIRFHQKKLGAETFIAPSEKQVLVWDKNNYRAVISNYTGVHLEVEAGANFEKAKTAIQSYVSDMNLPINMSNYNHV